MLPDANPATLLAANFCSIGGGRTGEGRGRERDRRVARCSLRESRAAPCFPADRRISRADRCCCTSASASAGVTTLVSRAITGITTRIDPPRSLALVPLIMVARRAIIGFGLLLNYRYARRAGAALRWHCFPTNRGQLASCIRVYASLSRPRRRKGRPRDVTARWHAKGKAKAKASAVTVAHEVCDGSDALSHVRAEARRGYGNYVGSRKRSIDSSVSITDSVAARRWIRSNEKRARALETFGDRRERERERERGESKVETSLENAERAHCRATSHSARGGYREKLRDKPRCETQQCRPRFPPRELSN